MLFTSSPPFNLYTLIVIYDSWFDITEREDYEKLGWIKAAELQIENNVICGDDKVSFYTSDFSMLDELKNNILRFKEELPKGIKFIVFEEIQ